MKVKFLVLAVLTAITLYLIPVEPVSAGWYVGGAIGNADDDVLDDDDSSTKLLGGYQFNEYFGVEGAFVDLGDFDVPASGPPLFLPAGTLSQEGVAIEAIGRYRPSETDERRLACGRLGLSRLGWSKAGCYFATRTD